MCDDVRSDYWGVVAEHVRVPRVTDQEGQKLRQIVRRGNISSVRFRRAMMLLASAGGNRVPVRGEKGIRWGGRPLATAS